jgi:hypothetical protein
MKVLVISVLFYYPFIVFGQTVEEPLSKSTPLSKLSIYGYAYPISAIGDVHKSFLVQYGFTKDFQVELQGFYDTYILTERFRSKLQGKIFLNENMYLLSGLEAEVATENVGNTPTPYRLGFVAGAGYNVNENFMLEVKSNIQLNNSKIGAFGEKFVKMPIWYSAGGKWKF